MRDNKKSLIKICKWLIHLDSEYIVATMKVLCKKLRMSNDSIQSSLFDLRNNELIGYRREHELGRYNHYISFDKETLEDYCWRNKRSNLIAKG